MKYSEVHALFVTLAVLLYVPSLIAKHRWSGENFTAVKFWVVVIYNVALVATHVRFIKEGYVPILGTFDNSIAGWLSFVFVFAYAYAVPHPSEAWPFRTRKQ